MAADRRAGARLDDGPQASAGALAPGSFFEIRAPTSASAPIRAE